MHKHIWNTVFTDSPNNGFHTEGNKYLSYRVNQFCDCGVYRIKEFINVEDVKGGDEE